MPDQPAGQLRIREEFPPVPTADWEKTIQADLKGADYDKKLVWKTEEGLAVKPYYRAEDLPVTPVSRRVSAGWHITEGALPVGTVNAARWHEQGATAVQELAFAIAEASEVLASGGEVPAIGLCAGSNYFFEIAKFRAARVLYANLARAYGKHGEVQICASTALSNKSLYDPYTNLLRATTEALSAVLGGCDSLHVQPARFTPRLALNVQRILKEEAHLDAVADPAGGAYYVEALTSALAQEAWKLFQEIESLGGWSKAQDRVVALAAEARAAKEKAVASRRKTLVGVNNYPDTGESALDESDALSSAGWRMASAIEAIRLRTERHGAKTGKRPRVLLLKRGDLKMKMARATFCQNFFGCGGFEIVEGEDLAPADLVVLCSSDPEYVELAAGICTQTKAPVVVAGNPKEQIEQLNSLGVAGYVHVMSNLVETLTLWQDKLGVEK